MWIVNIALNRPYTFIVMALLILLISPLVIMRTPTDIFPNVNIPVIAALWNYTGLSAEEMEERIGSQFERSLTTTVTDIEHIESQTVTGRSVTKIFFHPGAKVDMAMAQLTSTGVSNTRQMPPGTTPPFMMVYAARPASRSCNWRSPAKVCRNSNCSISPPTTFALSSRPWQAQPFPTLMAESSAR